METSIFKELGPLNAKGNTDSIDDNETVNDSDGDGSEEDMCKKVSNTDNDTTDKEEKKKKILSLSVSERFKIGVELKESGNLHIKSGAYENAERDYKDALQHIEEMKVEYGDDDSAMDIDNNYIDDRQYFNGNVIYNKDIMELRNAIFLNLSMACLKLNSFSDSISYSTTVINDNPNNTKALYRRACAYKEFGMWDNAKADYNKILELDKDNKASKMALMEIRKKIIDSKNETKKAFSGLFDKSAGLYQDRQDETEKLKEEQRKKEEEMKSQWHAEMNERAKKGETESSFDDWKKQKEKDEEEKKNEKNRQNDGNTNDDAKNKNNTSRPSKKSNKSQIDDDLDEDDKKIISETRKMGYCYFKREMTEEEKKLNDQHKPKLLDSNAAANITQQIDDIPKSISSWNAKGTTYEEKDMTHWAKEKLSERLKEIRVAINPSTDRQIFIEISDLNDINGDAHIAVVRGSPKYIFDFTLKLIFKLKTKNEGKEVNYKGDMILDDIASERSNDDWFKSAKVKFDKPIQDEDKTYIETAISSLKDSIKSKVIQFAEDYSRCR